MAEKEQVARVSIKVPPPWVNDMVMWLSPEQLPAFRRLKDLVADATPLTHPSPNNQLSLMVDASKDAVGVVLHDGHDSDFRRIAFFSKCLQPAEWRYGTLGRRLLAVYLDVKHFRHFIEGVWVIIFTDHKPLLSAIPSSSTNYLEREIWHFDYLS